MALAVGAIAWFLSREGPAAANLEATAQAVTTDSSTATTTPLTDVNGRWTVDTSIGEFHIDDPTATFAGFRVNEAMRGVGSVTAVGRTPDVSGSVLMEADVVVSEATIEVDFTTIVSNDSGRDDSIQDALNTNTHPTATFVSTEPSRLTNGLLDGAVVSTTIDGDLTINGITNATSMSVEAQLIDGSVLVVGSMEVVFADYGVEAPLSPVIVGVDDFGIIEVQLWLSRS